MAGFLADDQDGSKIGQPDEDGCEQAMFEVANHRADKKSCGG